MSEPPLPTSPTLKTLYRRPLPGEHIPFASPEGRALFAEALSAGGLEGYFRLAQQFHTQADPSFCGLGSLVVALNALDIDPGRLWRGPWRWFSEELLDCCLPLDEVRRRGISLDELACLARCNGARAEVSQPDAADLDALRAAVARACGATDGPVLVVNYDRATLDQTGSGHFSPIGGYHAGRDLALLLDVARFKYPPHWVSLEQLWRATRALDPATGQPRGWVTLRAARRSLSLGFLIECEGATWRRLGDELDAAWDAALDLDQVQAAYLERIGRLEMTPASREALVPEHRERVEALLAALEASPTWSRATRLAAPGQSTLVAALLLAAPPARLLKGLPAPITDAWRAELAALPPTLAAEVEHLAEQLDELAALAPSAWSARCPPTRDAP